MSKLKVFLKSGHIVDVECDDWKFVYNKGLDTYSGYEFIGLKKPKRLGILVGEIVGYIEI